MLKAADRFLVDRVFQPAIDRLGISGRRIAASMMTGAVVMEVFKAAVRTVQGNQDGASWAFSAAAVMIAAWMLVQLSRPSGEALGARLSVTRILIMPLLLWAVGPGVILFAAQEPTLLSAVELISCATYPMAVYFGSCGAPRHRKESWASAAHGAA